MIANNLREALVQKREEWLDERSVNDRDIMTDDEGREYFIDTMENGTSGEDGYSVDHRRVYIPEFNAGDLPEPLID